MAETAGVSQGGAGEVASEKSPSLARERESEGESDGAVVWSGPARSVWLDQVGLQLCGSRELPPAV